MNTEPSLTARLPSRCPSRMVKPQLSILPAGTLREILKYLGLKDLVQLMRVSRAFRDLAAAELYHSLSHRFSEAADQRDTRIYLGSCADILETLATSDFNYAAYLKRIALNILWNNDVTYKRVQEKIALQFKYDTECGRFFNTLILAIVKQTSALETFRWDIKVQLNPSIFAALGKLSSLQSLHVRLHAGRSHPPINSASSPSWAPAPLPTLQPTLPPQPSQHTHPHHHGPPPPAAATTPYAASTSKVTASQDLPRPRRTFSHIQKLTNLAVLDMDSLEYVDEIAQCISGSATSLKWLKLSFSEKFASKAQKKTVQEDPDPDTDTEDMKIYTTTTLRHLRHLELPPHQIQIMMLVQELDRVFIHELYVIASDLAQGTATLTAGPRGDSDGRKVTEGHILFSWEGGKCICAENSPCLSKEDGLDSGTDSDAPVGGGNADDNTQPLQSSTADPVGDTIKGADIPATLPNSTESASSSPAIEQQGEADPSDPMNPMNSDLEKQLVDIVDMEHPDELSEGEDQEFIEPEGPESHEGGFAALVDTTVVPPHAGVVMQPTASSKGKEPIRDTHISTSNKDKGQRNGSQPDYGEISGERAVQEYIRLNHGIALEELSIQLIPLKASVICRAVNVWSLKHISLLNVGPQRAFWAMLTALHTSSPLQITSIHTDNVTQALLTFLGTLPYVEDLFLIERSTSAQSDPPDSKSAVRIEDIREIVLRKHIKHLKRLMIRNDVDSSWNLDRRSVLYITRMGLQLVELLVVVDLSAFHLMMHYIRCMRSLVALHILLNSLEYCAMSLREIRLCAVDSVLHFPSLKVQYIAVSHMASGPVATKVSRISRSFRVKKDPKLNDVKMEAISKMLGIAALRISENDVSAGTSQSSQAENSLKATHFADDSDDELSPYNQMVVDSVDLHEIRGIKIWGKEIFYSIL
ncbi:hypothetical protein CISG_00345 [Coccidioides immitis RMSCC 3703]|uniref:F-box domain-containing protein n=1 Tax=Coccidioides immitis RMSCC 3703 TaxID=454286 RepID=A0A0J8QHR9_COCIT|nr:hypothetical protein CISG_00345 [Coccidioides immitis RMSCC 3703]